MCLKYNFFYFLLFFKHSKYLKNLIDTYALNGSVQKKMYCIYFYFFGTFPLRDLYVILSPHRV